MSDEPSASELERTMDRNHRETSADILDLKAQLGGAVQQLSAQLDRYVLAAVYEARESAHEAREHAQDERIARIETRDSSRWLSNRNAVLAMVSVIIGVVASAYIARSGH